LAGGSGELDHCFASGHASDGKSVSLKPSGYGLNVFVSCAELPAVLFRIQPLMKHRRPGSVYVSQETLARCFTLRRALQHKQHSPHREVIRDRAPIEFRPRQRMHGAVHRSQEALIHSSLGSMND
jgi:hypothetical protein